MDADSLKNSALNAPLFQDEGEAQAPALLKYGSLVKLKAGLTLFKENEDVGSDLYYIIEGRIDVFKTTFAGNPLKVISLRTNHFLGEISFFDESLRSATATTVEETVVLKMAQTNFERMSKEAPAAALYFVRYVIKAMCENIRNTTSRWVDGVS